MAVLTDLLQVLTSGVAPTGQEERALLARLSSQVSKCQESALPAQIDQAREEQYTKAAELVRRLARTTREPRSDRSALGVQAGSELPESYREFREQIEENDGDVQLKQKSAGSALHFLIEMLQYRTTSFFDYLESFQKGGGPRLDLSLAAMVDYDWWIEGGRGTRTPLREQVEVAKDLAVFTGGRVHAWTAFCPLRELMFRANPNSSFSSLELVRWAVEEQGAIGVKLYPPMGFAVAGNGGRGVWRDPNVNWLPPEAQRDDFGAKLDGIMNELFTWCEREGVPVLAHSNATNGATEAFERLALAEGWALALQAHPGLRVLFGHFGGASDPGSTSEALAFRKLMRRSGAGAMAYADASYWEPALENMEKLRASLLPLFLSQTDGGLRLLDRVCFGSDWKMLAVERRSGRYAAQMDRLIRAIAVEAGSGTPAATAAAFFGANAAKVLGLKTGDRARQRLDAFYSSNGVPRPAWAVKVDGQGT